MIDLTHQTHSAQRSRYRASAAAPLAALHQAPPLAWALGHGLPETSRCPTNSAHPSSNRRAADIPGLPAARAAARSNRLPWPFRQSLFFFASTSVEHWANIVQRQGVGNYA